RICTTWAEKPHCGKFLVPFINRTTALLATALRIQSCTACSLIELPFTLGVAATPRRGPRREFIRLREDVGQPWRKVNLAEPLWSRLGREAHRPCGPARLHTPSCAVARASCRQTRARQREQHSGPRRRQGL